MGVSLIGFMASGKSTVAAVLAQRLRLPWVDLDQLIEQREGETIAALFENRGEPGFRVAERAALDAVLMGPPVVLACGGGLACQPGALEALEAWGTTIYLDVPLAVLQQRVTDSTTRPLWDDAVVQRFRDRRPLYQRAGLTVDGSPSPESVVETILAALERGEC